MGEDGQSAISNVKMDNNVSQLVSKTAVQVLPEFVFQWMVTGKVQILIRVGVLPVYPNIDGAVSHRQSR